MIEIPVADLFMICLSIDVAAFGKLPTGYYFRYCKKDELDVWKNLHIDDPAQYEEYNSIITHFFKSVYAPCGDLFFKKCIFACDQNDIPVGTCFIWKAYGKINTLHWLKVAKSHEGLGIGRAIMSHIMGELSTTDFPVFLHTHPSSFRAIKLYSDFGFRFITDKKIGNRNNGLEECGPILKQHMHQRDFENLKTAAAPQYFLEIVDSNPGEEF